ncbi:phage tail protein [Leptolyngbya sp. AN02str]|uniref:phage tail protein n=1 Tax=Leptolyngbya sp. AN02str TaxID=3423363 RepID=UPI003D31D751
MTQARSSTAFSLVLTPMQVPEAAPESELAQALGSGSAGTFSSQAFATGLSLVLRPGEPSELMVQIRSQSSVPLQLQLQVEGDFPAEWCQLRTEGTELRPGQQMEGVLYFAIAPDYLEQTYPAQHLPLQLDFRGQLTIISTNPSTGTHDVETQRFQLYLRPRSLYLNFLPDLYRDVDFIGRFLNVFEQTFEPTVNTLETLWAYLDPLTAPAALLPFLAHWVGWEFDAPIHSQRQRFLIRHALQIYRWRGTRRGLRFYLHLVTGLPLDEHLETEAAKHIGIHENFSQGFVLGTARLAEDATLGGAKPYHFMVHLRPEPDYSIDEATVRHIIEREKPAFCTYDLVIDRSRPLLT